MLHTFRETTPCGGHMPPLWQHALKNPIPPDQQMVEPGPGMETREPEQ